MTRKWSRRRPFNPDKGTFAASSVAVTAVHVFDLGERLTVPPGVPIPGFETDFPERQEILDLSSRMFAPERAARLEVYLKAGGITLERLQLSNGKEWRGSSVAAFVSLYSAGFGAIMLRLDLAGVLVTDELIELAAMARGTYEKAVPGAANMASFVLSTPSRSIQSFTELYESIGRSLRDRLSPPGVQFWPHTFTCPFIYVSELVEEVSTKADLVERYPYQLAGISNMWINTWRWVTRDLVYETLASEAHPLEYGFTLVSPVCTIEVHPSLVREAARASQRTLESHHFVEWFNVAKLLEMVGLQFYALRKFNESVAQLSMRSTVSSGSRIRRLLELTSDGVRLSRERAKILPAMEDFWNIRLARRSYIVEVFGRAKESFLVNNAYRALKERLASLERTIEFSFSMSTAMFVIVLTIVSAVLGLMQVVVPLFEPSPRRESPGSLPAPSSAPEVVAPSASPRETAVPTGASVPPDPSDTSTLAGSWVETPVPCE